MSMGGQEIGSARYVIRGDTAPFEEAMTRTEARARRMDKQVKDTMGHVEQNVGKGSSRAAQGLLQLGYAIDDVQYGFRSIVNNIPQMVLMFGGGAGLAGGVAIASVAINQLVEHWDSMMNAFKANWLNVPYEQLEKLRIQTEKAGEAFQKLMETPTKFEAKRIEMIRDAMLGEDRGGPSLIHKQMTEVIAADPSRRAEMTDAEKTRLRRAGQHRPFGMNDADWQGFVERERQGIGKRLLETNQETARQMLGKAMLPGEAGQTALNELKELVRKHQKSFSEKFIKAILGVSPDHIERMLEDEARGRARAAVEAALNREQARDRAVAGQMIGGPIGRQVMMEQMGGGGGGGVAAQQRRITKKEVLKRALEIERKENLVGMPPEMMRAIQGGMIPPGMFGEAQQRMGPLMAEARKRLQKERADQGNQAPAENPMERAVRGAMDRAGAIGDPKGVLQEMRAMQDRQVQALMLERGLTQEQAQREVFRANAMRAFPQLHQPAQFLGIAEFAKRIQVGALGMPGSADIQKSQLQELQKIRQILGGGPVGGGMRAIAAGPG